MLPKSNYLSTVTTPLRRSRFTLYDFAPWYPVVIVTPVPAAHEKEIAPPWL